MNPLWLIAPAVAAGFGLLFMLFGGGHLFQGRFGRSGLHLTGGGLVAAGGWLGWLVD